MENPVFVVVQGNLKEGMEKTYAEYARGVLPLLEEFGIETVAVGAGFESEYTNATFPINIVMKLPDEETLGKFLDDSRYLKLKKLRDAAYENLQLSVFRGREPKKY